MRDVYKRQAGWRAVLMILLALVFRSAGAALCLLGTRLNAGERLFCVISYLPKATVQAAVSYTHLDVYKRQPRW